MAGNIRHRYAGNNLSPAEYGANNSHVDADGNDLVTSRFHTYVVASSTATAAEKAGADYCGDNYSDDGAAFQAALNAANALGVRSSIKLLGSTFASAAQISAKSNVDIYGSATITVTVNSGDALLVDDVTNSKWFDVEVIRLGTPSGNGQHCLSCTGTTDSTVEFHRCRLDNQMSHATYNNLLGVHLGTYGTAETCNPKFYDCYAEGGDGASYGIGWRMQAYTTPYLSRCTGQGGDGGGTKSRMAGGWILEFCSPTMDDCTFNGGTDATDYAEGLVINSIGKDVWARNLKAIGGTATQFAHGLEIGQSPILHIDGLYAKAGTGAYSRGLAIDPGDDTTYSAKVGSGKISNGQALGGVDDNYGMYTYGPLAYDYENLSIEGAGTGGAGALLELGNNGTFFNCSFKGSGTGGDGLVIYGSNPKFVGGRAEYGGTGSSVRLDRMAAPTFVNFLAKPPEQSGWFPYAGAGYSLTPVASAKYIIYNLAINVTTAGAGGSTIDIGTTDGGTEIATGIDTAATGWKYFNITRAELAADAPIYIKPSDTDARFVTYWTVFYKNEANCYALRNLGGSYAIISGGVWLSNGASDAVYIDDNAGTRLQATGAHIETLDPTNQKSIIAESAATIVEVENCTLIGATSNVSFGSRNFGVASNVTLDESGVGVIPHTCSTTPVWASAQCQSANLNVRISSLDATNINILVVDMDGAVVTADTHDFYWRASTR